jgi:hypothetical protein
MPHAGCMYIAGVYIWHYIVQVKHSPCHCCSLVAAFLDWYYTIIYIVGSNNVRLAFSVKSWLLSVHVCCCAHLAGGNYVMPHQCSA